LITYRSILKSPEAQNPDAVLIFLSSIPFLSPIQVLLFLSLMALTFFILETKVGSLIFSKMGVIVIFLGID